MLEKVSSANTGLVVCTLIDAVTLRNPAPRYPVGLEAKKISVAAVLPTTLQDVMFEHLLFKSDFFDKTNQQAT